MIAAVIVFYRPNSTLLERLLVSLDGQVDSVVAVDNTPGASAAMSPVARFSYSISYIPLGENRGIAEAQNIGIRTSLEGGCSHVILLDQDSVIPSGTVTRLLAAEDKLVKAGVKVAAVAPAFVDEKTASPSCAVRHGFLHVKRISLDPDSSEPVETDSLIASGSVIRAVVLQSVGLMRADLFIDFVDTEWFFRARADGYHSYCVPNALMPHSTGDAAIRIFGQYVYLHKGLRNYYKLRNAVYLSRLPSMGWQWRSYIIRWIVYYLLLNLWLSGGKIENTRVLLKGLRDGALGRLGPLETGRAIH